MGNVTRWREKPKRTRWDLPRAIPVAETWAREKVRDMGRLFVNWQSKLQSCFAALQADCRKAFLGLSATGPFRPTRPKHWRAVRCLRSGLQGKDDIQKRGRGADR